MTVQYGPALRALRRRIPPSRPTLAAAGVGHPRRGLGCYVIPLVSLHLSLHARCASHNLSTPSPSPVICAYSPTRRYSSRPPLPSLLRAAEAAAPPPPPFRYCPAPGRLRPIPAFQRRRRLVGDIPRRHPTNATQLESSESYLPSSTYLPSNSPATAPATNPPPAADLPAALRRYNTIV